MESLTEGLVEQIAGECITRSRMDVARAMMEKGVLPRTIWQKLGPEGASYAVSVSTRAVLQEVHDLGMPPSEVSALVDGRELGVKPVRVAGEARWLHADARLKLAVLMRDELRIREYVAESSQEQIDGALAIGTCRDYEEACLILAPYASREILLREMYPVVMNRSVAVMRVLFDALESKRPASPALHVLNTLAWWGEHECVARVRAFLRPRAFRMRDRSGHRPVDCAVKDAWVARALAPGLGDCAERVLCADSETDAIAVLKGVEGDLAEIQISPILCAAAYRGWNEVVRRFPAHHLWKYWDGWGSVAAHAALGGQKCVAEFLVSTFMTERVLISEETQIHAVSELWRAGFHEAAEKVLIACEREIDSEEMMMRLGMSGRPFCRDERNRSILGSLVNEIGIQSAFQIAVSQNNCDLVLEIAGCVAP